jgi:hypothetical protein
MDMERERMIGAASFILLLPLVVAWSRVSGTAALRGRRSTSRTARAPAHEQAIESIAVEVERIGEAQRSRRSSSPTPAGSRGAHWCAPRREPGTITPH